jgi:hypothetical protein
MRCQTSPSRFRGRANGITLAPAGRRDVKVTIHSQAKGDTGRPSFLARLTDVFIPEVLR